MRLIFKYLRAYPYFLFACAAPLLMLLEVFMDLMQPTLMARIIDSGLQAGDLGVIFSTGLHMLIVALIGLGGGAGCTVFSTLASTQLGARLRSDLFSQIQNLGLDELDSLESGNLITMLTNDVVQLEDITRMMLRIMVRAPLQVVGSLCLAILISPHLSLVFVLIIPLLIIGLGLIVRRAYPAFAEVQSCLDRINTRVQENLAAKRLVKAFVQEEREKGAFDEDNSTLVAVMTKASRILTFVRPLMQVLLSLGIVTVLWAGGLLIQSSGLQIGQLIAFINYLTQLLWSLMMLNNLLLRFSRAQVSAGRIQRLLALPPEAGFGVPGPRLQHVARSLEFRDVSFAYSSAAELPVLSGISLTARPGETIAILGATGSGKSTLVNLIPRFYDVTSGAIYLDGRDIRTYELASLRGQVSMAMQETFLFRGSIRSNILFGVAGEELSEAQRQERMQEAARLAGIEDFIDSLPEGYDTDLAQRGVNLSGGQKQRLAIARALACRTPVLILDDATSAVDAATELAIRRALDNDPLPRIRLLITQRLSAAATAHRILLLDEGHLAGYGTPAELKAGNVLYREIHLSQYGPWGAADAT